MSDKKVASFAELEEKDGIEYDTVDAYGTTVGIGQLSSADMFEWIESNASEDKLVRREAGLRLIVKSLVDGEKRRLPLADRDIWMSKFRAKSNKENGKVVAKILVLNGLDTAAERELKNGSGEA